VSINSIMLDPGVRLSGSFHLDSLFGCLQLQFIAYGVSIILQISCIFVASDCCMDTTAKLRINFFLLTAICLQLMLKLGLGTIW
jgi:hypothetical protein